MTESGPGLNEWRRLYQAAIRVKEIAPWEWMTEQDVFGVQDPETDETGFVSVMGTLGEHLAVAVYLGTEGLYSFWGFYQVAASAPPEALLGIPHLQASFEDRGGLTDKDRQVIKDLGLEFRGRQAWPLFRSYRPGYFPWYLEAWEARFLTYALEQAVEVAQRFKEDSMLLDTPDRESYLVRVSWEEEGNLVWRDKIVEVPPEEPEPIPVAMDVKALERAKHLPQVEQVLEIDFFTFPARIAEKGKRPYFAHMLLVVESHSGMVLGNELLAPEPGLLEMWGQVPLMVVLQFLNIGVVPRRVHVRSPELAGLLGLLAEELGFKVKVTSRLPSLDRAREFLSQRFM
jgi:hypothetical protein